MKNAKFTDLVGKTITAIDIRHNHMEFDDEVMIYFSDESVYRISPGEEAVEYVAITEIPDKGHIRKELILGAQVSEFSFGSGYMTDYTLYTASSIFTIGWAGDHPEFKQV